MKEKLRYKWERTGVGVVDNLGYQFQKVARGANQGSIQTRYRYVAAAERFLKYVGEEFKLKNLSNLHDKHVLAYAQQLKEDGKASKYIKTELSAIRYWHRQMPAAKHELSEGRQFNMKIGLGSTKDGRADRAWSDREVREMVAKANEQGRERIGLAISFSRAMGTRLDETATLRTNDLQKALRDGYLHLTNTKGGRPRDVPVSAVARDVMERALRGVERGGYVFREAAEPIHVLEARIQDFVGYWRDFIQDPDRAQSGHNLAPGEKGALSFHGLRHSFAREAYQQAKDDGLNEKEAREKIAQLLGHNRAEVTMIYTLN